MSLLTTWLYWLDLEGPVCVTANTVLAQFAVPAHLTSLPSSVRSMSNRDERMPSLDLLLCTKVVIGIDAVERCEM